MREESGYLWGVESRLAKDISNRSPSHVMGPTLMAGSVIRTTTLAETCKQSGGRLTQLRARKDDQIVRGD